VQCSAVWCIAVYCAKCGAEQYSTLKCTSAQCSTVHYSTVVLAVFTIVIPERNRIHQLNLSVTRNGMIFFVVMN
jgi:hypothetical protein